mgnify:CR=1 FL=1
MLMDETLQSELHTYDEWLELGYQVCKGEKSIGRNNVGKCVFSAEQVTNFDDMDEPMCYPCEIH